MTCDKPLLKALYVQFGHICAIRTNWREMTDHQAVKFGLLAYTMCLCMKISLHVYDMYVYKMYLFALLNLYIKFTYNKNIQKHSRKTII